jgi:hypothetical protein
VTRLPGATTVWPSLSVIDRSAARSAVTVTFADFVSEQPDEFVTVTCRVSVPTAPAVKVTLDVPVPPVMVPFVIDQL